MFQSRQSTGWFSAAFNLIEVIFHSTVRSVRSSHSNAFMALFTNMLQAIIFVVAFYVMFSVLGLRSAALRGDFLVYLMSGIFLFLTHIKAVGAVAGAEGPASPMMQHAPMNTIVAIVAAALGSLYVQTLSMFAILFVYDVAINPIELDDPVGTFAMYLLSWFTGCAVGLVFLALRPWAPAVVGILTTVYQRANMIASGKMFVANAMPSFMIAMFDWNPLFHLIDQARGFAFINYVPRHTDYHYAIWVGIICVMLGLMGEFYSRRHASLSWEARR